MTDENRPKNSISADWVLKRILEGKKVRLRNAVIEGDLDLSKLSLPTERIERTEVQKQNGWVEDVKIVTSSIAIINSVIQGELNFSNSTFIYVDFQDTKFIKDVNFQDSKFSGYAKFEGTQFGGEAGFSAVQFSEEADFMGAKFGGYTTFQYAQFSDFAKFCGAQFSECPYFERTKFSGETDFMSAKFSSDASFQGALFSGYANCHSIQFSGEAYFQSAQFNGYANFIEAKFNGDVNFVSAQFNDDANFLGAKIKKTIDLDQMKCDRFYVSWETLKGHLVYDGATYLSMVRNFKNLEQFGDADSCYYQYRKESQTKKDWYEPPNKIINFFIQIHGRIAQHLKWIIDLYNWLNEKPPLLWIHSFNWSKFTDHLSWISCGYGLKIWPMMFWIAGTIVIFAIIYNTSGGIARDAGNVSPLDSFYFSTFALAGRMPPDNIHSIGSWKYVVVIENLLGYVFLALFVVVLGRKVVR